MCLMEAASSSSSVTGARGRPEPARARQTRLLALAGRQIPSLRQVPPQLAQQAAHALPHPRLRLTPVVGHMLLERSSRTTESNLLVQLWE